MMLSPTGNVQHRTRQSAAPGTSGNGRPMLLVFPFGLLSHYLRCLMLARHFSLYYEVLFVKNQSYNAFVEEEGFGTFDCLADDAAAIMECVNKFDFSWLNEAALEPVFAAQAAVINRLKPAAVLGDNSPTLKMAAEKTGVTFISLMNGYMTKYYALGRKISRTHPLKSALDAFPPALRNIMTKAGEAVSFYKVHKPFKKMRLRHGLSLKFHYLDELEGDINLVCDLADLFPQKKLPGSYHVIAPLFYASGNMLTGIVKKLNSSKQTIFVSMGSTGDWNKVAFLNDEHFARYNIVAAADLNNILHSGHIIKTPFVNTAELFPFTSLVICHGGNGTVYQSLYYGIPVLCKTTHFEQEWNADALERAHAGKSLDNISTIEAYINVMEEWIHRKTSAESPYSKLIGQEIDRLPQIIGELSAEILAGNDL